MPTFSYQSLTSTGQARTGVITAPDRADALRQILTRGETATSLDIVDGEKKLKGQNNGQRENNGSKSTIALSPSTTSQSQSLSFGSLLGQNSHPTLRRPELASFVRELATALEAGLPLMNALRTVRRQATGRAMPVILDYLIERVESGDPLHLAARDYGPPFDDMVIGMLRAADASGRMSEVLHQLADLLERSVELRREVLGATIYPLIVAGLIAVSVIILVTFLVPRLIGPLIGEAGFELPWPTKALLAFAYFVGSYWIYCVVAVAIAWFAWRAWANIRENRMRIDRIKLQLPIVGRLLRDVSVARFTRTLGTLISAGLPILDALRITRDTLGNSALMEAVDQVQDQVTSGKSLADPLDRSGLFPALLIQVVNLGERSGRLETMLLHAATAFDRQVTTSVKLFTKALPPLLLIVMATIGGFVLAAILLPLLELQSLVR